MIRVLALLVAIGLVAAGYLVREQSSVAGREPALGNPPAAATRVRCDAELEAACRALRAAGHDVTVEPAGVTYEELNIAEESTAPDVWVTVAPWPTMVDEARARAGLGPLFTPVEEAVATSPLVVVIWDERAEVLEPMCATAELTLGCVAGASGERWADLGGQETWGFVKLGLGDPVTSSVGLAALAVATADELGTSTFGTRSLAEGTYLDWLSALAGAVPDLNPPAGSALAAMLQVGPAAFDLAVTTEAAAISAREGGAQRATELRVLPAAPPATVDAVVASREAEAHDAVVEVVAGALDDAAWMTAATADGAAAAIFDGLPGASLPGAGAHTALRNTFDETVR
jgi:hypothetical protein